MTRYFIVRVHDGEFEEHWGGFDEEWVNEKEKHLFETRGEAEEDLFWLAGEAVKIREIEIAEENNDQSDAEDDESDASDEEE